MKKTIKFLSDFIKNLTLCFTLVVMSFTTVGSIVKIESFGRGLAVSTLVSFFWFSCLISLTFCVCGFINNNLVLRRTAQFLLSMASTVLIFFTGEGFENYLSNIQNPAFSVLAICFGFVVIYTLIAVAVLIFGFIRNKLSNSTKEYTSMFDSTKNN